MRLFPGTTLKYDDNIRNEAFSAISPILEATGGITLSQLSAMTGIEPSTIQNWIKRGWVSSTKGKKYSQRQVARIILINMLRGIIRLEDIAGLMRYVNGDVEDSADDIIDDTILYNILCRIIFDAEDNGAFEVDSLKAVIDEAIIQSEQYIKYGSDKLRKAMLVMILAYRSSYLKSQAEIQLRNIL